MKKLFVIMFAIISIITVTAKQASAAYSDGSAIGAAISGGYPVSGLSVTGKFAPVPLVFGANFGFYIGESGYFSLNLTADWWGLKLPLGQAGEAAVSMYLGPGAALSMYISSIFVLDIGIRMPVGFSFLVQEKWEIFLEPSLGLNLIGFSAGGESGSLRVLGSSVDNFGFGLSSISFNFQFGFRYWL